MRLLPDFRFGNFIFSLNPPYTINGILIKEVEIFHSYESKIKFRLCNENNSIIECCNFSLNAFKEAFQCFIRSYNYFGEWHCAFRPESLERYIYFVEQQCYRYQLYGVGVYEVREDIRKLYKQRKYGRESYYRGSRYELSDSARYRYCCDDECNVIAEEDLYWGEPVRFNNNVDEHSVITSDRIAEISENTGLRCLEINQNVGNLTMHNGDGSSVTLNNVSVSINNASTENDVSDERIPSDGYGVIGTYTPVGEVDVSAIAESLNRLEDSISRMSGNDSNIDINDAVNHTDTIESTENNEHIIEASEEPNVVDARGSNRSRYSYLNLDSLSELSRSVSASFSAYGSYSDVRSTSTSDTKNYIHGWSYKPTFVYHTLENEQSPLLLGAEIEVAGNTTKQNERSDRNNVVKKCIQIMNGSDSDKEDLIYSTADSTVQIEIDTMPCSLEYHKTMNYKKMFEYLDREGYKGHDCDNAGLHIHADRKYLGNSVLKQELVISKILYILEKFNDQICRIARRGNTYSKFVGDGNNEKSIAELYKKYRDKGKYVALNLSHKDTIEFRCFKSTLKYETFILTLEFVQDIINFAKQINIEDIETITWDDVMSTFSLELKRYYYNRKEKEEKAKNSYLSNTEVYAATSADVSSSETITVRNDGGINIRSPDDAVCINNGAEFVHLDRGDIVFSSHDTAALMDTVDNNVASDLHRSCVDSVEALQSVGFLNASSAPLEGAEDYAMTDNSIRVNAASTEDVNVASNDLLRAYYAFSNACNMIDNRAVVTLAQSVENFDEQRNGVSDL